MTRVSLGQILTLIVTISAAITAGTAAYGVFRQDKKLQEIHVLVNSNLTAMQTRNEQLAKLLAENQVPMPPAPQPPDGTTWPKKVT